MGAPQQRAAVAPQQQRQQLPERASPGAMPPHEPSGLPTANGTSGVPPPLLKVLQASAGSAVLAPEGDMLQPQRPQNGAAAPSKAAAVTSPAAAPPGRAPANAAAQRAEPRAGQQTAVPTPAVQATAATPTASPPAPAAAAGAPASAAQQAAAAAAALANPGQQAVADLEAILGRIMNLDAEGWFRHPVRHSDAPNYYKIIKRPMCFEVGAQPRWLLAALPA